MSSLKTSQAIIQEFSEAFSLFDSEQTGYIDARSLKALMKVFGLSPNKKEITKIMMAELNKEITDSINFDEFTSIMATRIGERESKENLEKIFKMFDEETKGGIGINDLIRISKEIGEELSHDDLVELMRVADRDKDGFLNFEEFTRVMKLRNNPVDDLDSDLDE